MKVFWRDLECSLYCASIIIGAGSLAMPLAGRHLGFAMLLVITIILGFWLTMLYRRLAVSIFESVAQTASEKAKAVSQTVARGIGLRTEEPQWLSSFAYRLMGVEVDKGAELYDDVVQRTGLGAAGRAALFMGMVFYAFFANIGYVLIGGRSISAVAATLYFVEDNWRSPSLAAWGVGWEVWLDGLEITQFTYFQQMCGVDLDPICVEITYGVERIVQLLQRVSAIPEIQWVGDLSYGDLHLPDEIDYCRYNFEYADLRRLQQMYTLCEEEGQHAITQGLVLPAYDYLLKCSHIFNVLDSRGAIGVIQRTHYFARMGALARQVAAAYLEQRKALDFPLTKRQATRITPVLPVRRHSAATTVTSTTDFLFEIGTEELPAQHVHLALEQLKTLVPKHLQAARICPGSPEIHSQRAGRAWSWVWQTGWIVWSGFSPLGSPPLVVQTLTACVAPLWESSRSS
ncbi:MAG: glycine--tRNA ligase subunit alpha [Candidatus Tectomicrobia bacterium]|nr:glycine--tRNA ligase subunit alpha [Candidatus Tectomicrobia bacterium]